MALPATEGEPVSEHGATPPETAKGESQVASSPQQPQIPVLSRHWGFPDFRTLTEIYAMRTAHESGEERKRTAISTTDGGFFRISRWPVTQSLQVKRTFVRIRTEHGSTWLFDPRCAAAKRLQERGGVTRYVTGQKSRIGREIIIPPNSSLTCTAPCRSATGPQEWYTEKATRKWRENITVRKE